MLKMALSIDMPLPLLVALCAAVMLLNSVEVMSHVCLISPPQRGSLQGINKQGAADCFLLLAPCGGRSPDLNNAVTLRAGQNFTVTFQKNLDHWLKSSPGVFYISIGDSQSGKFQTLAKIPDKGEPSLTLYSANITIPNISSKMSPQALQILYLTNNPGAPEAFFQCADVFVASP